MARRAARVLVVVSGAGLLVGGCQGGVDPALATGGGAVAGGVVGALAGRQIGGGPTGAVVGALVGAGAGALAGNLIAQRLNAQEQARQAASTQRVLEAAPRPGVQEAWTSPTNPSTRGSSELLRVTDGGSCRTVREVAYVGGQEVRQDSRFCRDGAGRWARQA